MKTKPALSLHSEQKSHRSSLRRRILTASIGALIGIAAARDAAQGAAIFWDGGGSGFGWSSNILGLATGDDLTFVDPVNTPVGKRLGTFTNDTTVTSLNSLTFNASAGAITLDGSQIGLAGGGLTNNSSATQTISFGGTGLTLGASQAWTAASGALNVTSAVTASAATTLMVTGSFDTTLGGIVSGSALTLTKAGAGKLTLTKANTYGGFTNVNAGTLVLGNGGSIASTRLLNVASGATLAAQPGATGTTNAIGGALTLNTGTTFTMADGATSTLTVAGATTFGGAGNRLSFDVGGATTAADRLSITGAATISAAGGSITINPIGATPLTPGAYPVISAASGLDVNPFTLGTTKVYIGTTPFTLSLANTAAQTNLNVAALVGTDQAFWTGAGSATWGLSNFNTTSTGTTAITTPVSAVTDVFFNSSRLGVTNLTNTLGGNTTINSLNFTPGSGAVTINPGGFNLTLNAGGVGNLGITVAGGAATRTVATPLVLRGAQTWTNNGSFGALTLRVTGPTITRSANVGDPVFGQLSFAGSGFTDILSTIDSSFTGGVIKSGVGSVILEGSTNTFTGGVTVNQGELAITSDGALGATTNKVTLGADSILSFLTPAITLSAARDITFNGSATNPSGLNLQSASTQTIGNNQLLGSGAVRLTITGGAATSTLAITGANLGFTGSIQVGSPDRLIGFSVSQRIYNSADGATLRLQNSGTVGGTKANGARLTVTNGAALTIAQPTSVTLNRLGDMPLNFDSGRFQYSSGTNGNAVINDTFGDVNVTGLLSINGTTTSGPGTGTNLAFGNLNTETGALPNPNLAIDHATLLFRGPQSGLGAFGGGNSSGAVKYRFTNLTPETASSGTTRSVIPYAANANTVGGTDPFTFMTYDANGFRPLNTTTEAVTLAATNTLSAAATGVNIRSAFSQTIATQTINSYSDTGTSNTISGNANVGTEGDVLTSTSGAYSFSGTNPSINNATLNFPNGGYFHLGRAGAFQQLFIGGNSRLKGISGIVASALVPDALLVFSNTPAGGNTFTGGLYANGNAGIAFSFNNQLGNDANGRAAGDVFLAGGTLLSFGNFGTLSLSDGPSNRAIKVNASNGSISNNTSGAILQIPGVISGPGQVEFGGGIYANPGGIVELTNPAPNTYSGGSLISSATLRLSNPNQLGTGPLTLRGGTLQAAANLTFPTAPTLIVSSTIDTQGNNLALNAGVNGSGGLTGGEATTLSLTKAGSGTLTIGGNGNFAGVANVAVGTLALGNGANLDTSTVNVFSGATLAARPGVNGATNNIANNINLNTGASLSMADGATSTLAIAGNATLGGGTGSFLTFDIGGTTTTTDRLAINGTASIGAGGTISINTVGSTPLAIATYPLITAAAGLPTSPTGLLLTTKVYVGTTPYTLSVLPTATTTNLRVQAFSGVDQAFWTGAAGGTWNTAANFNTTVAGGTPVASPPSTGSDVFFATSRPTPGNLLTTTLGNDTQINSLTFTSGSGAVTIGAGNTLFLDGGGAGNIGIAVTGASSPRILNPPLQLNQQQTWLNNGAFGATTLTVAGPVDGNAGVRLTVSGRGNTLISGLLASTLGGGIVNRGPGTLTLGNSTNSFTGGVTINGGVVSISNNGSLGNQFNSVTIGAGGTLRFSAPVALSSDRAIFINGTAGSPSGIDVAAGATQVLDTSFGLFSGGSAGSTAAQVSVTGGTSGTLAVRTGNSGFAGNVIVGAPGKLIGHLFSPRSFSVSDSVTLLLEQLGSFLSSTSVTVNNGSALRITQPAAAQTGRLSGAAPLTFHSGRFEYDSSTNSNAAITENFGPMNVTGQLSIYPSSATGPTTGTTLNFASLNRADNATVFFVGPQSAYGGTPSASSTRYLFNNLTQDTTTSGFTRSVVPFAATSDAAVNDPANFVTYDANGFRPLDTTTEVRVLNASNTLAGVATGENVRNSFNGTQTIKAGGQTINSLSSTQVVSVVGSATASAQGDVLTVTSGAFATYFNVTFSNSTVSWPNGAFFHLGFPTTFDTNSRLTGSGGVVATSKNTGGAYTLSFTNTPNGGNTFTGGLFANGNATVTFTQNNQLGNDGNGFAAGNIVLGGGQLIYRPGAAATVNLSDTGNARSIKVNDSNGTIGTGVAGATLQIPGIITGVGQLQFGGAATASSATGVVELTNPGANTYTGGTVVSVGTLRISAANQLGTGPVFLNGGTLQASGALNFATAPTLIVNSTIDTQANNIVLNAGLNGSGGVSDPTGTNATALVLTKIGNGTLTIGGDSNFAGTVAATAGKVVVSGAISGVTGFSATGATTSLELGASDLINDAATVTLAGSTLNTAGFSETIGTLSLGTGVSTIDLGSGASVFQFANSSGLAWTGSLSILNWSGLQVGGGTDQLYFGTTGAGLTPAQIGQITFVNPAGIAPGTYGALLLPTGELIAVPEPSTSLLLLGGLSLLGYRRRRK